jgi:hypothetical protein
MPGQWPMGQVVRPPQGNNPRTGRPWGNTDQDYYEAANYVDTLGAQQRDPGVRAGYHQYAQQLRDSVTPVQFGGAMVNPRTGEVLAENPVHVGGGRVVLPYSGKELYSGTELSDEDARFVAYRMYSGDPGAMQGVPRGMAGVKYTEKIYDQLRDICSAHGESEEMCAGRLTKAKIQYAGNISAERALSTLEIKLGNFAVEAVGAIQLARTAFDSAPRTSIKAINRLIAEGKRQSLDPQQRQIDVRVSAVKNAYAAVMGRGSQVITDYARKRADELFDGADSPEAARAALDTAESEMRIAVDAPDQIRQLFYQRYGAQSLAPAAAPAGAGAAPGLGSMFTPGAGAGAGGGGGAGAGGGGAEVNWRRGADGHLEPVR